MNLSEFKAWFEGYTEGIEGAPSERQFSRIKAKVADIDGKPVTQTIFVDRYLPTVPWNDYWHRQYVTFSQNTASAPKYETYQPIMTTGGTGGFDSYSAMYALGKAEAVN